MKNQNSKIILQFLTEIIKSILLISLICLITTQLSTNNITPLNIMDEQDKIKIQEIKYHLQYLAPQLTSEEINDISKSIKISSEITNIDEKIIIAIAYYESNFKKHAISTAGYKGIMQATTHDIFEFSIVDIIRGTKKLEQWIYYRKGNLRFALASYNGGTYPPQSSYQYADNVIQMVRKLEKNKLIEI
jgi:soluble lytic murein transglycosylase-like protein